MLGVSVKKRNKNIINLAKRKKRKKRKKKINKVSSEIRIKRYALIPLNVFFGLISIICTVYLGREAAKFNVTLISIELLTLLAGLILESYRISKNWETLLLKIFTSFLLSFLAFAPGKHEYIYNFANHILIWPYYLIFFFALFTVIFNREKVTAKLTEGITLLLSISAVYWTIDYGFVEFDNFWEITLLTLLFPFTIVTLLHAFTNIKLDKGSRLFLSIWSTIILVIIACDNIKLVFGNERITKYTYFTDGFSIGIQYFLLGISTVYIMQNFILLYGFLPEKGTKYKYVLRENIKRHVERYSEKQVLAKDSVICIIYSVFFYVLNYYTNLLPRNTMIWLVVFTFPIFLEILKRTIDKMNYR